MVLYGHPHIWINTDFAAGFVGVAQDGQIEMERCVMNHLGFFSASYFISYLLRHWLQYTIATAHLWDDYGTDLEFVSWKMQMSHNREESNETLGCREGALMWCWTAYIMHSFIRAKGRYSGSIKKLWSCRE